MDKSDAKFRTLFDGSAIIRNADVRLVFKIDHKKAGKMMRKWEADGLIVRDHTTKQAAYYRKERT